jgi:hypothetical protein
VRQGCQSAIRSFTTSHTYVHANRAGGCKCSQIRLLSFVRHVGGHPHEPADCASFGILIFHPSISVLTDDFTYCNTIDQLTNNARYLLVSLARYGEYLFNFLPFPCPICIVSACLHAFRDATRFASCYMRTSRRLSSILGSCIPTQRPCNGLAYGPPVRSTSRALSSLPRRYQCSARRPGVSPSRHAAGVPARPGRTGRHCFAPAIRATYREPPARQTPGGQRKQQCYKSPGRTVLPVSLAFSKVMLSVLGVLNMTIRHGSQ